MKKLSLLPLTVLTPTLLSAQASQSFFEQFQWEIIIGMIILIGTVTILALLVVWSALNAMVRARRVEQGLEVETVIIEAKPGEEHLGFWARFWNRFNSAVPVAVEHTVATDHEYDGIRELDNKMPPWWLYTFYVTIIFGIVYILNYEIFGSGMTQDEEYQAQMTDANEQVQTYLASLAEEEGEIVIELLTDQAALAAGATIYKVNCAQCHAADGGGMNGLGPNLTDKYWKNGGDFDAIVSVVQNGVSGTSMIPWSSQLRPAQIQEIASYVYSLEGTTPAVPKAPEGELFERSAASAQPTSDTTAVEP